MDRSEELRLAVVSKSCYSHTVSGRAVPAIVAGHTSQLARGMIEYAIRAGHQVAHIYPLTPGPDDVEVFDADDGIPEGVHTFPFTEDRPSKSSLSLGWLSASAALTDARESLGHLDWVLLLYGFPLAPLVVEDGTRHGFRVAVFLRGGDGYKWLREDWWRRTVEAPSSSGMARLYKAALRRADYVAAASRWLASTIRREGVDCHSVIQSPPLNAPIQSNAKLAVGRERGITTLVGQIDPCRKWLLSAGRASQDKRPDLAVSMFNHARLDGWQLILAAPGPLAGSLRDAVTGLKPNSAVLVRASPRVMPVLYQAADGYLHTAIPSRTFIDARPSAVTSAAYYRTPVIAPRASAGGVTESLSRLNRSVYCFDVGPTPNLRCEQERPVIEAGTRALGRLTRTALRTAAGFANGRYGRHSAPERVFNRLFDDLQSFDGRRVRRSDRSGL